MKAFHDDPAIKEKYLNRLQEHYDADEIIKGKYWENGKGCAVGCTIHSSDHSKYEDELMLPQWIARLEDTIFEGLPNEKAKKWPILFLNSIKVGSNLEKIKIPFLIFIVESVLDKFDHEKFPKVKKSIENVIYCLKNNSASADSADTAYAKAARAAYAAANAEYSACAAYAAANAEYSACAAYAAADTADAAHAAAADDAAGYAAAAAADAAHAAAADDAAGYAAAAAADAAHAAGYAAKEKTYKKFADKLIQLIEECD